MGSKKTESPTNANDGASGPEFEALQKEVQALRDAKEKFVGVVFFLLHFHIQYCCRAIAIDHHPMSLIVALRLGTATLVSRCRWEAERASLQAQQDALRAKAAEVDDLKAKLHAADNTVELEGLRKEAEAAKELRQDLAELRKHKTGLDSTIKSMSKERDALVASFEEAAAKKGAEAAEKVLEVEKKVTAAKEESKKQEARAQSAEETVSNVSGPSQFQCKRHLIRMRLIYVTLFAFVGFVF